MLGYFEMIIILFFKKMTILIIELKATSDASIPIELHKNVMDKFAQSICTVHIKMMKLI